MNLLEKVRMKLNETEKPVSKIYLDTGIHYNTIQGIKSGTNTNPTWYVLETLGNYFDRK